MNKKTKLVYGVGINDAPEQGVFYITWKSMLRRCYSGEHSSYATCVVCDEWLTFSKFKAWMKTQDWEGKQLDKDLLSKTVKIYSPETCVFVPLEVNNFLTENNARRGKFLIGVTKKPRYTGFSASVRNPLTKKREYLPVSSTELEAHLAWKRRKHELACLLAEKETDPRIIHALTTRYAGDNIYEA